MRSWLSVAAAMTVACGSALADDGSGAVSMRSKWVDGRRDVYHIVQENEQHQPAVPDHTKAFDNSFRLELTLERRVVSHDDKTTTLELRIQQAKVALGQNEEHSSADTARPDPAEASDGDKALLAAMRRIVDLPLTVVLDRNDDAQDVKGNESPDQNTQPYPQFVVGDMVLKDFFSPLYRIPSSPASARAGQAWDRVDRNPFPPIGTIIATTRFTVDKIEKTHATLLLGGSIEVPPAVGPASRKADLVSQSIQGDAAWNFDHGTLESYRRAETLELEIDSPFGPVPYKRRASMSFERVVPGAPAVPAAAAPVPGAKNK